MNAWQELLARAERERELATEGRWEELAEHAAERARLAALMPPATREAAPVLARLAEIQAELETALTAARADTVRELSGLRQGRSAVRSYASAAGRGGWVDETH